MFEQIRELDARRVLFAVMSRADDQNIAVNCGDRIRAAIAVKADGLRRLFVLVLCFHSVSLAPVGVNTREPPVKAALG